MTASLPRPSRDSSPARRRGARGGAGVEVHGGLQERVPGLQPLQEVAPKLNVALKDSPSRSR